MNTIDVMHTFILDDTKDFFVISLGFKLTGAIIHQAGKKKEIYLHSPSPSPFLTPSTKCLAEEQETPTQNLSKLKKQNLQGKQPKKQTPTDQKSSIEHGFRRTTSQLTECAHHQQSSPYSGTSIVSVVIPHIPDLNPPSQRRTPSCCGRTPNPEQPRRSQRILSQAPTSSLRHELLPGTKKGKEREILSSSQESDRSHSSQSRSVLPSSKQNTPSSTPKSQTLKKALLDKQQKSKTAAASKDHLQP